MADYDDSEEYTSSETETDTESEFSDVEDIYEQENEFIELEKNNHSYYLGISRMIKNNNTNINKYYYLLVNSVSSKTFLNNPYYTVLRYLQDYSIIQVHSPTIDIMKLEITADETYTIIKKTYWLRLVQRHWKKIIKEREMIYNKRCTLTSQNYISIHGRYPKGLNSYPVLSGMLGCYNN